MFRIFESNIPFYSGEIMPTLEKIVKYLETIAPRDMAFGGHESRVEIGPQGIGEMGKTTINRVLISTYPSGRIVTKATQERTNLLITHWPLFPYAIDRITGLDLIRVRLLTKNYISSYVLGSAYIGAKDGLADALVNLLQLEPQFDFMVPGDFNEIVPAGRVCKPKSDMNHSRLASYIADKMNLESILFNGDFDQDVSLILVIPGSQIDMYEIISAKRQSIETIVTGELAPAIRLMAHEEGLNTLELGAFVTVDPGMRLLRHHLSLEFPDLKIDFVESTNYYKSLTYQRKM